MASSVRFDTSAKHLNS